MLLVVALNGAVILEQPANSLLEYYPRFRDWIRTMMSVSGVNAAPCLIS